MTLNMLTGYDGAAPLFLGDDVGVVSLEDDDEVVLDVGSGDGDAHVDFVRALGRDERHLRIHDHHLKLVAVGDVIRRPRPKIHP